MGITSAIVLFAVIWFLVLFITLPIRLTTQGDTGEVTRGTMPGAPAELNLTKRLKIVTAVAAALWLAIAGIIFFEVITVCDFDWFDRMGCQAAN